MPSGGRGPATVRYNMIASEQTAYNIALGSGNLWLATLKLVGIAGLLPAKYGVKVPQVPQNTLKDVIQYDDKKGISKWLEDHQKIVYEGVQKFIEEEYKKGALDF